MDTVKDKETAEETLRKLRQATIRHYAKVKAYRERQEEARNDSLDQEPPTHWLPEDCL